MEMIRKNVPAQKAPMGSPLRAMVMTLGSALVGEVKWGSMYSIGEGKLTGKATEMIAASGAVARLTMAIEMKVAMSRLLGLNLSGSSGATTVSILFSRTISVCRLYMDRVDQGLCRNSRRSQNNRTGLLTREKAV